MTRHLAPLLLIASLLTACSEDPAPDLIPDSGAADMASSDLSLDSPDLDAPDLTISSDQGLPANDQGSNDYGELMVFPARVSPSVSWLTALTLDDLDASAPIERLGLRTSMRLIALDADAQTTLITRPSYLFLPDCGPLELRSFTTDEATHFTPEPDSALDVKITNKSKTMELTTAGSGQRQIAIEGTLEAILRGDDASCRARLGVTADEVFSLPFDLTLELEVRDDYIPQVHLTQCPEQATTRDTWYITAGSSLAGALTTHYLHPEPGVGEVTVANADQIGPFTLSGPLDTPLHEQFDAPYSEQLEFWRFPDVDVHLMLDDHMIQVFSRDTMREDFQADVMVYLPGVAGSPVQLEGDTYTATGSRTANKVSVYVDEMRVAGMSLLCNGSHMSSYTLQLTSHTPEVCEVQQRPIKFDGAIHPFVEGLSSATDRIAPDWLHLKQDGRCQATFALLYEGIEAPLLTREIDVTFSGVDDLISP